jgi:hypothetical protein
MIAWVLIIALGSSWSVTVPGIASEADCRALAKNITAEWSGLFSQREHCFPYQAAPHR